MAFEVLDQQYRQDEIRAKMQADHDGINRLKNQPQTSANLHTEIVANPAMIPWYAGLSQAEKDKLLAWKSDAQELLDKMTKAPPEGLGF